MFACVKRGEKRGRDVRQKENDGERDRDENVGGREGADDEFRPQLINLLCILGGWMDEDGWLLIVVDKCWYNKVQCGKMRFNDDNERGDRNDEKERVGESTLHYFFPN